MSEEKLQMARESMWLRQSLSGNWPNSLEELLSAEWPNGQPMFAVLDSEQNPGDTGEPIIDAFMEAGWCKTLPLRIKGDYCGD